LEVGVGVEAEGAEVEDHHHLAAFLPPQ